MCGNPRHKLHESIWEVYQAEIMQAFRETFRHHPNLESIMARLENDLMLPSEFVGYLDEARFFTESWLKDKFNGSDTP